jgi:hypothetical protein
MVLDTREHEIKAVSQWLAERAKEGIVPREIGVFVRSPAELVGRSNMQSFLTKFSITTWKPPLAVLRSALCIWPRAWNSAQWL